MAPGWLCLPKAAIPQPRLNPAGRHHIPGVGEHDAGWVGSDAGEEISQREVDSPKNARGALCR